MTSSVGPREEEEKMWISRKGEWERWRRRWTIMRPIEWSYRWWDRKPMRIGVVVLVTKDDDDDDDGGGSGLKGDWQEGAW